VGLVDFAHAYMNHPGVEGRQPQVDAGCKLGIGNLITLFEQFAARKYVACQACEGAAVVVDDSSG
jgi:hypothetical protein